MATKNDDVLPDGVVIDANGEKTLTLPKSGATVVIKKADDILMEDRDFAYDNVGTYTGQMGVRALMAGVVAVAIKSWTLPLSIPMVDVGSIKKLQPKDFDFISKNIKEIEAVIYGTETTATLANEANPKARGVRSNG